MASKLMKRCVQREALVQKLAWDKSPEARKARIGRTTASQWRNRAPVGNVDNVCSGKCAAGTVVSYKHFQG